MSGEPEGEAGSSDTSGIATLATEGSVTFLGNIVGKALNFGFLIVVTNLISPATFGLYSLGLSIIIFVKTLSDLGIYRGLDYFIPQFIDNKDYGKVKYVLANVVIIALLGTGLASIVLIGGGKYLAELFGEPELPSVLTVLALAMPLLSFKDILVRFFISLKELKYRVFLDNLVFPAAKLLIVVSLLAAGFKMTALLVGYLFSLLVVVLVGVYPLKTRLSQWASSSIERVPTRNLVTYSLPLAFAGIIYTTASQIDYIIIGYLDVTTSEDLAIYRVATQLGTNLMIVITAFGPVFKPMIVEARGDTELLESRYKIVARWTFLLTLPVAITFVIAPETYLSLLFSPQYAVGGAALSVLAIGYLVNAVVGPEAAVLEGLGYTKLTLVNTVLMIGVNTILDLLLIPHLGILGAAIGTAVGMTCAVGAGVIEIRYYVGVSPFGNNIVRMFIAAIPTFFFGYFISYVIKSNLFLSISLPVSILISYFIALRLINPFEEDDRIFVDLIEERIGYNIISKIID